MEVILEAEIQHGNIAHIWSVTPRPERVYGMCNRRGEYVYQNIFLII